MKKVLVVVALLFVPLLASAQQMDAVLTPDGTLYSVAFERAEDHPDVQTESAAYLKLTIRRGEEIKSEIVPATLEEHFGNYNPIVAYDAQSGMLFVFWIRGEGIVASQLMFSSRNAQGVWAPATVFGDGLFDQRKNLRIAVTRKFRDEEDDLRSGVSVHLAWWEPNTTTGKGAAKYAMASIHDGRIVDFVPVDLSQFIPENAEKAQGDVDKNFLKQPILFPTPLQDSVMLLFGDVGTNTMNQVRITPRKIVGDGRLRVPGGRREGSFGAPKMPSSNSRVEGVYGDNSHIALYEVTGKKLNYVVLNGETWSEPFAITLDDQLSAPSAVDALRRLVSEH